MAEHIERGRPEREVEQNKGAVLTEIQKSPGEMEMPPEVKRWMELRREEVKQPQSASPAQQVLKPAAPQNPKIVIPSTRKTFGAGFKKAISDAGRWFSVFWFRVIKMKKGTVEFKEENV
ncbi:hypothetical protein M1116_01840 [Patescibacteria group bacterium]|nr:hypothetical protein [Patescibacteria group bacterium]